MPRVLSDTEIKPRNFQPKVKNRFVVSIDGVPAFVIKGATLPEYTSATQKIDFINSYFKIAGKAEWQPVTFTCYDPVSPSASQAFIEWVRLCYESATGRAGYADFYKKDIDIELLGPPADGVSKWTLYGAFVESVNFGDLDWSDDGSPIELSITVQYDRPILQY